MKWDSTHRAAVQNYTSQGYRYTQDFRDALRCCTRNLNATGRFATTFEAPDYDADDDNGDWKAEEAEITSTSSSFPSVNSNYYAEVQFSHWYLQCGGGCPDWIWDPDQGEVGYSSQISRFYVYEWDTYLSSPGYRFISYPYQSQPAGFAGAIDADLPGADEGGEPASLVIDGIQVQLTSDNSMLDVVLGTPEDVDAYKAANERRIDVVGRSSGPYHLVVTFTRPLSVVEFRALAATPGLRIDAFEAIGHTRLDQILTIGGDQSFIATLRTDYEAYGARFRGVVAADVHVDDLESMRALAMRDEVYLADVAAEFVSQSLGPKLPARFRAYEDRYDVILDDVYWLSGDLSSD